MTLLLLGQPVLEKCSTAGFWGVVPLIGQMPAATCYNLVGALEPDETQHRTPRPPLRDTPVFSFSLATGLSVTETKLEEGCVQVALARYMC